MIKKTGIVIGVIVLVAVAGWLWGCPARVEPSEVIPGVPRTWDDEALATLDVPLADRSVSIRHIPSELYYQIPAGTIYKTYPVYHPDHEPEGYMEWLEEQEPEVAFDPWNLTSREDWIAAGRHVFEAGIIFSALVKVDDVRDREWYETSGVPVAANGVVPYFNYVIRKKGKVLIGEFSCSTCHTRVMDDGQIIVGAPSNYPLGRLDGLALEERIRRDPERFEERRPNRMRRPFGAPWMGEMDPARRYAALSAEESVAAEMAVPPGVQARFGTGVFEPVAISDLIGLEQRRYFDRTGHVRHRSIVDLMRYGALNQGIAFFDTFGDDFIPSGRLPNPKGRMRRYSDEQLYALALFLYSLEPPENPHPFDERAARGRQVFEQEDCGRCHAPPLYTNNKLTPVDGYEPGDDHPEAANIHPFSVETDPGLALYTRRGSGFYKVPSLKGLWYRGPYGHSGMVATLEDWFDPNRHRDDYVPTGFRGHDGQARGVSGHKFGLKLSAEERADLIAFLKTL